MKRFCTTVAGLLIGVFLHALALPGAHAVPTEICVVCSEPQQTYICRINTQRASPGDQALQFYCMVRTAKDGGHKSCAVARNANTACAGPVKTYSYDGPNVPEALRSAVQQVREKRPDAPDPSAVPDAPVKKDGEPDTLVEMTTRAVGASKEGVKATGDAVKGAAGTTGKTIGKYGKKAGKQVGKTARGAKSAARYTYDCVLSLFRDCSSTPKEIPAQQ